MLTRFLLIWSNTAVRLMLLEPCLHHVPPASSSSNPAPAQWPSIIPPVIQDYGGLATPFSILGASFLSDCKWYIDFQLCALSMLLPYLNCTPISYLKPSLTTHARPAAYCPSYYSLNQLACFCIFCICTVFYDKSGIEVCISSFLKYL